MSFTIAGGTRTGPHHRSKNEANQDFYGWQEADDIIVMAVADGAGSLPHSAEGAVIAVMVSITAFLDSLDEGKNFEEAGSKALAEARQELLNHERASTMGCTLALAASSQDAWIVAVVGDAFAVIEDKDGLHFFQPPRKSEYANVTALLTSDSFSPLIASGTEAKSLAVASDGLQNASIAGEKPTVGFWTPLLKRLQADKLDVDALLAYMDGKGKLDDDTTVVAAVQNSEPQ